MLSLIDNYIHPNTSYCIVLVQKIIPDSVSKELTGDTVEDVFPDSSTTSHDSVTKPDEDVKTTITVTTGVLVVGSVFVHVCVCGVYVCVCLCVHVWYVYLWWITE